MTAPLSVVEIGAMAACAEHYQNKQCVCARDGRRPERMTAMACTHAVSTMNRILAALSAAGYVVVKEEALNDFINETLSNIAGIGLEVDSTLGRAKEHRAMLQAQQEDLGQP